MFNQYHKNLHELLLYLIKFHELVLLSFKNGTYFARSASRFGFISRSGFKM
jgi:hypothetical protein